MQQNKYDIISFDFWNTLVSKNPEYKINRNIEVQKLFPHRTIDEVNAAFSFMKNIDIETQEISSVPIKRDYLFDAISGILVGDVNSSRLWDLCDNLFLKYPPILIPETKETIEYLYNKGYKLAICSNTGFAAGWLLDRILKQYDILKYFKRENRFYSDAVAECKPRLLNRIIPNNKTGLHIGDRNVDNVKGIENLETYQIVPKSGISQIITKFNL